MADNEPNNPDDKKPLEDEKTTSPKNDDNLRPEDKQTSILSPQDKMTGRLGLPEEEPPKEVEDTSNSLRTRQLNDNKALALPQDRLPDSIVFHIREGNVRVQASPRVSLILGRKNSTLPVDIDLMPYKAVDLGISRQHIKIEPRGTHLVVKDLHSVNGSLLNRFQMRAGHFYDLSDGDELKLGRMHVTVRFLFDE